jgi:hypothetical protein
VSIRKIGFYVKEMNGSVRSYLRESKRIQATTEIRETKVRREVCKTVLERMEAIHLAESAHSEAGNPSDEVVSPSSATFVP